MKKRLPWYLILTLFTFFGCENENLQNENSSEQSTNQSSNAKIDNLSMDQLSKDKQFDEISNTFNLDEKFATARNAVTKKQSLDKNDFEIDFSSGTKFESVNGVSYTFMIKNDEENPTHFENLVVEKHNDGTVNGFIVYYEYSQRYLDSLKKGVVIPFDGTLRRTANKENLEELKDFFKNEKTAKSSTTAKTARLECIETKYVTQSLCPAGIHSNGQTCDYGTPATGGLWFGFHLQTVISCNNDTWGWVADSQSYSSTVPAPYSSSGGGNYSTTATVEPSLFSDVASIQSFVNLYGLTGNEIEWARYIPNRSKVNGFRDENDYNDISKLFVKPAANALVNEGIVDFAYKVIIDKTLKKNPCLYGVYTQLGQAPTFQSYLQKFDGNFSVANLKFSIGIDSTFPDANAVTTEPQNYLINIMFNPTKLNRPQLDIARTFIHELLHAEIYRKLLSVAGKPNIPWTKTFINSIKDDYPGLFDYF